MRLDYDQFSNLKTAIAFCYNGKLLKRMIEKKYILKEDLFEMNDKEIIRIFAKKSKSDREIAFLLDILKSPISSFNTEKSTKANHLFCKVRRVNPYVLNEGKFVRYSDINKEYRNCFEKVGKFNEFYLHYKK